MPQKRCKRRQRRQVGMGIGRHTHPGAGRPVEHPGWNLKPTVGIGTAQITAKNNSRPTSRSPHERRPEDQTTDAMGTAVPETRFRGRSQALLYNTARPHSRLGWMSPAIYAAAQRSAALRSTDGSAPRTAAITAQQGIEDGQTPIAAG